MKTSKDFDINISKDLIEYRYQTQFQPRSIIEDLISKGISANIKKDRTGSGATHSILSIRNSKIFLISPTIALVKEKQQAYIDGAFRDNKISFYHGESETKMKDHELSEKPELIMCTIDQLILSIDKLQLNPKCKDYILIIDELHVMVLSQGYRERIRDNFDNLIKTFKQVLTVTATPLYVFPKLLKKYQLVEINREQRIKELRMTSDFSKILKYIENLNIRGEKLILVSNDRMFLDKMLGEISSRKVATIMGKKLRLNIKYAKKVEECKNPEIYCLSSAGMEGIDINDPHINIIVHNKYNVNYGHFLVQNIVQALGRARKGTKDIILFNDKTVPSYYKCDLEDAPEVVLENIQIDRTLIGDFDKYSAKFFEFGYKLLNIDKIDDMIVDFKHHGRQNILDGVKNILVSNTFEEDFISVKYNAQVSHSFEGFSTNILFAYLIADVIRKLRLQDLDIMPQLEEIEAKNKTRQLQSIMKILYDLGLYENKFTTKINTSKKSGAGVASKDFDNLEMLYYMTYPTPATEAKIKELVVKRFMEKGSIPEKYMINSFLHNKKKEFSKSTKNKETKKRNQAKIKKITKLIENLDNYAENNNTLKIPPEIIASLISKTKWITKTEVAEYVENLLLKAALKLNRQIGIMYANKFTYGTKRVDNRLYSAITSAGMSSIAAGSPIQLMELDLKSAHPTIVNAIVGFDDGGYNVYERMVKELNITRPEAKKLYSTILNSTAAQMKDYYKREKLTAIGYNEKQCTEIIKMNVDRSQNFDLLTRIEWELVSELIKKTELVIGDNKFVRRHDSIIIFNNYGKKENDPTSPKFDYFDFDETKNFKIYTSKYINNKPVQIEMLISCEVY